MGRTAPSAQWSELPDELLEMVRSKVACPRGRIRVAAVCMSWRAAAFRHPSPPALPLLLLSPCDWGTRDNHKLLYCPEDAGVLRVPLPACLRGTWFNGSYDGGWIAAGRLRARVVVANLFSGAQVPLSEKQSTIAQWVDMAVMNNWSGNCQPFFKLFELAEVDDADSDDAHDYKWVEVHSLGDYALFLGLASSSRAVRVPAGGRGGVNRNHIYYSKHRCLSINTDKKFDGKAYLTRSIGGDPMYCKEDEGTVDDMKKIPSLGYHVVGGPYPPVWCLPPDF